MKLKFMLKTLGSQFKDDKPHNPEMLCMFVPLETNHPFVLREGTISWFLGEDQKYRIQISDYRWRSITIKKL